MSPRGGKMEGAGRKPKVEGDPTEVTTCRIRRSNKQWLVQEKDRTGKSLGDIMDKAIDVYRASPADHFPDGATET